MKLTSDSQGEFIVTATVDGVAQNTDAITFTEKTSPDE
ncbi:hypothetical protein CSC16_1193 [Proteus mirabilis]|nr:hypothetical protein CSC16_2117 [Proteus mirabilis]AWF39566.1 hypothetical protein CSC16_1193 [Proteus mirabilis]